MGDNFFAAKLKFACSIFNGDSLNEGEKEAFSSVQDGLKYVSSKDIDVNNNKISSITEIAIPFDKLSQYKVAPFGSPLLCIEGGSAGRKIGLTETDVCFVNKLACFRPKQGVLGKFIFYLLLSKQFNHQFNQAMTGMIGGVSISRIKNFEVALTSYDRQRAIAEYLDNETKRIDTLISEKQSFIDLLKEKRQALISHYVTKGLDANVSMKESGIEWIGMVPEHWETCLIKHKVKSITDGAHISPVTEDGKHLFVSIRDLNEDEIDFSNSLLTDEESYQYLVHTGCQPRAGDLLFSKDGTVGKTIVTPADKDFVVASSLVILRKDEAKSDPDFLNFLCKSNSVQEQVNMFVRGAALRRVSIANLNKVWGTFPPVSEQREIAQTIKHKIRPLNELQTETCKSLELLKEHRTALISAAVTGKIDVRNYSKTEAL